MLSVWYLTLLAAIAYFIVGLFLTAVVFEWGESIVGTEAPEGLKTLVLVSWPVSIPFLLILLSLMLIFKGKSLVTWMQDFLNGHH